MAHFLSFMNKVLNAGRLPAMLVMLANPFQNPLLAGNECGNQPAGDDFNNAVIEFQTSKGKNRFASYHKLLLSAFDCPAGSRAGILVDEYPVKKHITYEMVISRFGEPDFRFTTDAGTKNWPGSGKDAAYYYLGMVKDGMAYYYYYAAIVLRNGEPESAATLYFPDRIEYMFPEIMNREPVTTGVDLKSENLSVFGIGLGASLTRVLAQAKVQGIAVSKRAPGKWPDTIAGYEIFGTLDNSDGAKVVTVMALDDVIYSITGAMRNRILFDRLKQQLENEIHLKPNKQDRSYVYNVDAAGGAITIRMFDATANLHTSPLLIGFRDAKVSAVAKEEIKKYLATPNPGTAD